MNIVNSAVKKIKKIPSSSNKNPNIENNNIEIIKKINFLLKSDINKELEANKIINDKYSEKLKVNKYVLKNKVFNNN